MGFTLVPYCHWANNVTVIFLSSCMIEYVYSPKLPWRSKGYFKHNINFYPRRYSFKPLGEEKQL